MKHNSELISSLNKHFKWNKSRISCFAQMLLGLIAAETVNLQKIALAFSSKAEVSSRYRRLQRFFAFFEVDFVQVARWIFKLFFAHTDQYYLVIDRTNWYRGKNKINVFVLSVAYEGIAIPLFWELLPKAGNSNYAERKVLLERFINTFGTKGIVGLLADREFGSGNFFAWLNRKRIPFYIRIKEGSRICLKKRKWHSAKKLFCDLNAREEKAFGMDVAVFGQKVFLAGSRSEGGELMIVATNQSPKNAIPIYLRRWEIESLFQSLKGRGFQFEETHMTDLRRVEKLMALLAVGFAWAHKVGEWYAEKRPILLKKFKKSSRPQWSYFRYGLDFMREVIFHIYAKVQQLKNCIKLIDIPLEPLMEAKS